MSEKLTYREKTRMVPLHVKPSPSEAYVGFPEMPYPTYERVTPMDVLEYYEKWSQAFPAMVTREEDVPEMIHPDFIEWPKPQRESDWPGLYDRELFRRECEWAVIRELGHYLADMLRSLRITWKTQVPGCPPQHIQRKPRPGSYLATYDDGMTKRTFVVTPPRKKMRWCTGSNEPATRKITNQYIKRAYVEGYKGECAECRGQFGVNKDGTVRHHV